MIKKFIDQILLLIDNGKLLRKPFRWFYIVIGAFCFLPVLAFVVALILEWDTLINLLGSSFWTDFVTVLMCILFAYALVLYAFIGWHYWRNRKNHLENLVPEGARIYAIPLVADFNQSKGDMNSLFLVLVGVVACVLGFLACMLTDGFGFWSELTVLPMILGIIGVLVAVALIAYLNMLLVHFVSERLRVYAQIGNDVHHLATTDKKEPDKDLLLGDADFHFEKPSDKQKRNGLIALGGAVLVALIVALCISIGNMIALHKSVFEELPGERVAKLEQRNDGFSSAYYDARDLAARSSESEFGKLSYGRFYKFMTHYANNEAFINKVKAQADANYVKKYLDPNRKKLQAKLDEWKDFIETNDPESYLKVAVTTSYFKGEYGSQNLPEWYFTVTEPKGTLKSASVFVVPRNSNGRKYYGVDGWNYTLDQLKATNAERRDHLTRVDDNTFWDNYSMSVTVNSVTMQDGTVHKAADVKKVPSSVKKCFEDDSEENLVAMAKDQIDKSFMNRQEYVKSEVQKALQEKDELCFKFINR